MTAKRHSPEVDAALCQLLTALRCEAADANESAVLAYFAGKSLKETRRYVEALSKSCTDFLAATA